MVPYASATPYQDPNPSYYYIGDPRTKGALWWPYANERGWNRGKDRKGGKR